MSVLPLLLSDLAAPLLGMEAPSGYSASWLIPVWSMNIVAWVMLAALVAYLAGAVSLWRRGQRWSPAATLSFVVGSLLVIMATGTRLNGFAGDLVSVLLFQQITLMVVAPPFLLIGAPGRLLLRATPHAGLGRSVLRAAFAGYRSRAAWILLHPIMALVIAAALFPGLYFSDAVSWVMGVPGGHTLLLIAFVVLGVVAGAPLWARDPLPRRPSYVVRLIEVFVEIQIHAVFGLVLLRVAHPLFSAYTSDPALGGISRLLDQAVGGGLVWTYGELPLIIALIVTLSKWRRRDLRTAKSREVEDDAALDEYNAYLAAQRGGDS